MLKFIFNIYRCVVILIKMIFKVLLEDCVMYFFFCVFICKKKKRVVKIFWIDLFFFGCGNLYEILLIGS